MKNNEKFRKTMKVKNKKNKNNFEKIKIILKK